MIIQKTTISLTWSEIELRTVELNSKFVGIRIREFSTDWMDLFERDWIDIVSTDIHIDDVVMVEFWPIFKWIFNADVVIDSVSVACVDIVFAACFW